MKIIILRGLPASGKSTWARKWVNEAPKERVRVNRDDIRNMLGPYWIPQREDLVTEIENQVILGAKEAGYDIVIDATNLRGIGRFENLRDIDGIRLADRRAIEFIEKDFTDVPIEECVRRDNNRDEGKVGEQVIRNMAKKYGIQ